MNIFCLIWLTASLLLLLGYYLLAPILFREVALNTATTIAIFGFVLFLNFRNRFHPARFLFLAATLAQCIYFSIFVQPNQMVELCTLTVVLAGVVLYRRFIVHLAIFLISLVAALLSHLVFQDPPFSEVVSVIMGLVFGTAFLMMVYLKRINQEKEAELIEEKNKALKDKQTIEDQSKQLNELHQFKDNFFINISHELRTPLTLIRGYSRRLSEEKESNTSQQYIEVIEEQSASIQQLADDILDLGKMDKQQIRLTKSPVDLASLISKTHSEFHELFARKNIALQLKLPAEKTVVICDPLLMTRAITNLVTNALKFTPSGGKTRIEILKAEGCLIEVYNTGTGIAPEDLDKIFDRFYQVDHPTARSQGSGIGLSLVKGIVEAHGFDIRVESQHGAYALFSIDIPAQSVRAKIPLSSNGQPTAATPPDPGFHEAEPSASILLVEDNAAMRKYITGIKGLADYQLLQASHGSEALDIIKKEKVDLVITDYMMPVMNGPELIRQLQSLGFLHPVLLLTARTDPQSKLDMLRLGVDAYLTKPFLEEELLHTIHRALEHDRARKKFLHEAAGEGSPLSEADELLAFNQRLTRLIDENISNGQFDITDICHHLHLTERTLYRKVKELCGSTPAKLITERRLLCARAYYEQKKYKSVRQLSLAVGFKNSTRFAQKFYERFGIRP